jgi:tyrosyl-tRNA synthetase
VARSKKEIEMLVTKKFGLFTFLFGRLNGANMVKGASQAKAQVRKDTNPDQMDGTASNSKDEDLYKIYNTQVMSNPFNKMNR